STLAYRIAAEDIRLPAQAVAPLGHDIAELKAEGEVKGTLPAGTAAAALAAWRDAGGTVEMRRLVGRWGPLSIDGDGTVALDKSMEPEAAFALKMGGLSETLDTLVAAGAVDGKRLGFARTILGALDKNAAAGGAPATKVPVTIQDGFLFLGPIKLLSLAQIGW